MDPAKLHVDYLVHAFEALTGAEGGRPPDLRIANAFLSVPLIATRSY